MDRRQVTNDELTDGLSALRIYLHSTLEKHGKAVFSSTHEILGILEEERMELVKAIHENDHKQVMHELLDIAQTAIFGYITLKSATVNCITCPAKVPVTSNLRMCPSCIQGEREDPGCLK